jgi:hypothetical protein
LLYARKGQQLLHHRLALVGCGADPVRVAPLAARQAITNLSQEQP